MTHTRWGVRVLRQRADHVVEVGQTIVAQVLLVPCLISP
jgi:hypothetical protein